MKEFSIYSKENLTGAEWCVEHAGKMAGVPSLSTSPKYNKRCALRKDIEGSICQYTSDYIEEHDVFINCGSRDCITCQKCYHKNIFTSIKEKVK